MTQVGARQLRQWASELLRRGEAGETFEVTDHGRPVALLGPLRERRPLDRLRASGDLEPAREALADLPEPLELPRGHERPSKVLARLRRHER
ncbi:MAG: type II toxin-antitoxin system prevent-host-death family antitoxin [Actinobacteria bacterium]|nr:type II toxin-antitoxin system prevent-host-death family antitoxin [Actinomycetota bacterium]